MNIKIRFIVAVTPSFAPEQTLPRCNVVPASHLHIPLLTPPTEPPSQYAFSTQACRSVVSHSPPGSVTHLLIKPTHTIPVLLQEHLPSVHFNLASGEQFRKLILVPQDSPYPGRQVGL